MGVRMFGRRKVPPVEQGAAIPRPPVDSDGNRRVFGEAIFAGQHGDMLRKLGFSLDDPANIVPSDADFEQKVNLSLAKQEHRRRGIEADLLAPWTQRDPAVLHPVRAGL